MGHGYEYAVVSSPTADAVVQYESTDSTFVDYLRHSLRWGGFPGWERLPVRPERDLATLTKDLTSF